MSELPLVGDAGDKKWSIPDGIDEIKREIVQRDRVYPRLIGRGTLDQRSADKQVWALAGTLRFLEFCLKHEAQLREVLGRGKGEAA